MRTRVLPEPGPATTIAGDENGATAAESCSSDRDCSSAVTRGQPRSFAGLFCSGDDFLSLFGRCFGLLGQGFARADRDEVALRISHEKCLAGLVARHGRRVVGVVERALHLFSLHEMFLRGLFVL
jgi:hypothetical protein